jgi:hypothetical protein
MKFKRIYFEQKRRSIKITILKTLLKKYECMSRENNQNHSVSVKIFIRPKRDFKHYFSLIIQKKKKFGSESEAQHMQDLFVQVAGVDLVIRSSNPFTDFQMFKCK